MDEGNSSNTNNILRMNQSLSKTNGVTDLLTLTAVLFL